MTTLLEIIYSFGKIGLVSLGGGNSMLKLIETEIVDYRHWVGKEEFISMLGAGFLFPGLTAVKLAALIGYKAGGLMGLILALTSLNLPGIILATVGYHWLSTHSNPITNKIMIAVQYGALALLAAATYSVAQGVIGIHYSLPVAILTVIFFLLLAFLDLSPFWGFMAFIAVCFFVV